MSSMGESKVTGIITSLNDLENNLDSLNSTVSGMKKQLSVKTLTEMDTLLIKTRELATKEAQTIIKASKEKADLESKKIIKEGESRLSEVRQTIDSHFDEAVKHVVSTVLKA